MIINTNIGSLNAQKNLSGTNGAMQKSLEKLSSGFRINKAADDAAGLAISEKMRGQVSGLKQASRNAQSAISLIQTAEGALNETHSILQRMRELATQSASDTNTADDRSKIQAEMDQLSKEITRISNTTEFNTKNLLAGNLDDTYQVGANQDQNIGLTVGAMDAESLGVASNVFTATLSGAVKVSSANIDKANMGTAIVDGASLSLTATATPAKTAWTAAALGITGTSLASTSNSSQYNDYTITVTKTGGAATDVTVTADDSAKTITINYDSAVTAANSTAVKLQAALDGAGVALTATGDASAVAGATDAAATTDGLAADEVVLTFNSETQIVKNNVASATFTSAANKGVTINFDGTILDATTAATLTIDDVASTKATFAADGTMTKGIVQAGIDVSTQANANTAITDIDKAIQSVSSERSKLGAMQNRLEHTINNLGTSAENLTAAESKIRDVDMAAEMSAFTKNQVLSQAGVAMLAQANQAPQSVLKLLG